MCGIPVKPTELAHVVTEILGSIMVDGFRARIVIDNEHRWMKVGCTKIHVDAIRRLYLMTQTENSKEIVLQEAY